MITLTKEESIAVTVRPLQCMVAMYRRGRASEQDLSILVEQTLEELEKIDPGASAKILKVMMRSMPREMSGDNEASRALLDLLRDNGSIH